MSEIPSVLARITFSQSHSSFFNLLRYDGDVDAVISEGTTHIVLPNDCEKDVSSFFILTPASKTFSKHITFALYIRFFICDSQPRL